MLKHSLFFILLISACWAFSQSSDHDGEIMQIKGKWTKHDNIVGLNDPDFPKSQYPFVYKKTDSIATFLKRSYPNPTAWKPFIIHQSVNGRYATKRQPPIRCARCTNPITSIQT